MSNGGFWGGVAGGLGLGASLGERMQGVRLRKDEADRAQAKFNHEQATWSSEEEAAIADNALKAGQAAVGLNLLPKTADLAQSKLDNGITQAKTESVKGQTGLDSAELDAGASRFAHRDQLFYIVGQAMKDDPSGRSLVEYANRYGRTIGMPENAVFHSASVVNEAKGEPALQLRGEGTPPIRIPMKTLMEGGQRYARTLEPKESTALVGKNQALIGMKGGTARVIAKGPEGGQSNLEDKITAMRGLGALDEDILATLKQSGAPKKAPEELASSDLARWAAAQPFPPTAQELEAQRRLFQNIRGATPATTPATAGKWQEWGQASPK